MRPVDLLIVGAGEYVSGLANGAPAGSDKGAGVVALVAFDLRRRGKVGRVGIAARDGARLARVREHFASAITARYALDASFDAYPAASHRDDRAAAAAMDALAPGSAVVVVTPDDTHFALAMAAIDRGLHVLVAKPLVRTLAEHVALEGASRAAGVVCAVEMHKRFDPFYADARERARALGDFTLFTGTMSQPRSQLDTFRAWAGVASDVSYYLNAHHVDVHAWIVAGRARPVRVFATAATGVAERVLGRPVEDAIALSVEWENLPSRSAGVAIYTAAWTAPRADVHSQQRFTYLAHGGEVAVDQARRGFTVATDERGLESANPLFMRYTPASGRFAGQTSYGYRSIEAFVDAARAWPSSPGDDPLAAGLATVDATRQVTAILEAGRRSLDRRAPVAILYDEDRLSPTRLE